MILKRYSTKGRNLGWKIIISSIALIIYLLVLMPAVSSVDSEYKFPVSIKPNELDEVLVRIRPIKASNHFLYGFKATLKYFFVFRYIEEETEELYGNYKDELGENLSAWKDDKDDKFDDFFEELRGIKFGLDLNDLEHALYMGIWLSGGFPSVEACTTTAATNDATFDDKYTFLHANIDNFDDESEWWWKNYISRFINVAKIAGEYNYAFFSIPVLGEWPILNEKDVGFVGNGLRLKDTGPVDKSIDLTDMPSLWLTRRSMMDCDRVVDPGGQDLSDVEDLWKDTDRASGRDETWPHVWDNMNMLWSDGFGNILAIEQMHEYFVSKTENPRITTTPKPNILFHTNHHKWNNGEETGSIEIPDDDYSPKSGVRLERAYKLLKDEYGNLDADYFINDIAKDHNGNEEHSDEENDFICNFITRESYIIQSNPDNDKWVYWSRG